MKIRVRVGRIFDVEEVEVGWATKYKVRIVLVAGLSTIVLGVLASAIWDGVKAMIFR